MLDVPTLAAHLLRLSYRPGWVIDVYDGRYEGPHLRITADLQDSTCPGAMVSVKIHSMLPPFDTVEKFEEWLLWRLIRIECHEAREWFQRDGKAIADPHADAADHDL